MVGLSHLLTHGSFHLGVDLPENYRNPNCVTRMVSNLIWHHSDGDQCLKGGSAQDLALVELYRSDPSLVLKLAGDLRPLLQACAETTC